MSSAELERVEVEVELKEFMKKKLIKVVGLVHYMEMDL